MTEQILGGLALADNATRLEGWCWSSARPGERLVADILVDDQPVASIMAALFRIDLADRGIGDGRHGFSMRLPESAVGHRGTISGRCGATRQVFASISVGGAPQDVPPPPVLAVLAVALRRQFRDAAGLPPPARSMPRLAAAFGLLGDRLSVQGSGSDPARLVVAAETLRRRYASVSLAFQVAPRLSLVLPAASDVAATMAAISALAPHLPELAAEIVLVDDGRDPQTALIHTRVSGLSSVFAPGVAADGRAAAQAHGKRLLFLDPLDARPVSAAALIDFAQSSAGMPVVAGPAVRQSARRVGWLGALDAETLPVAVRCGVRLAVDAATLAHLGGFARESDADPALAALDLCLRARRAGLPVRTLAEPMQGGVPEPAKRRDPSREAAFAARWSRAGAA